LEVPAIISFLIRVNFINIYHLGNWSLPLFHVLLFSFCPIKSCNLSKLSDLWVNVFLTCHWQIFLILYVISMLCICPHFASIQVVCSYPTVPPTSVLVLISCLYSYDAILVTGLRILLGRSFVVLCSFFHHDCVSFIHIVLSIFRIYFSRI
jgi:hypothetical protein